MLKVLTHHLGWVETVMPSTRLGEGGLHKPAALGLEEYSKLHWYNPTKVTLAANVCNPYLPCLYYRYSSMSCTGWLETQYAVPRLWLSRTPAAWPRGSSSCSATSFAAHSSTSRTWWCPVDQCLKSLSSRTDLTTDRRQRFQPPKVLPSARVIPLQPWEEYTVLLLLTYEELVHLWPGRET